MGIKPQDLLILVKLLTRREPAWRLIDLAEELKLSLSEVSFGLERARNSRLMDSSKKRVLKAPLLEFIQHGVKYVFPVQPGPICRGVPTSHSAPPLSHIIVSNEPYVWPDEEGPVRGQSILPLYKSVPAIAREDSHAHEMLALVDALRIGRVRERVYAEKELKKRIIGKR